MKDAKNIMAIFEPEASIIDMGFIAFVTYIYMSGTFMTFCEKIPLILLDVKGPDGRMDKKEKVIKKSCLGPFTNQISFITILKCPRETMFFVFCDYIISF